MHETAKGFITYTIQVFNKATVHVSVSEANENFLGYPKQYPFNYSKKRRKLNELTKKARENQLETEADNIELGEKLYETLFDPAHQSDFISIYDKAIQKDKPLLIQLEIDEIVLTEVAAYPWEFMRTPKQPGKPIIWLATNPHIAFSRRRIYGREPLKLQANEVLRIALVVSDPPEGDLGKVEYLTVIDTLKELANNKRFELLDVIGIDKDDPAVPDKIDQITRNNPDILHFIGHGRVIRKENKDGQDIEVGELALVDDITDEPFWVNADYFCNLLSSKTGLVILQSCDSGTLSRERAFVGVASSISQQNIPAVVAMQYEISNSAAKCFIEAFYESFAENFHVDRAVQYGRRKITRRPSMMYNTRDFATPIVYLSVDNGKIFQLEEPKTTKLPSEPIPNKITPEKVSPINMLETIPGVHYVERKKLFEDLESKVLNSQDSSNNLFIISGPGGNGKTTCIREFCGAHETKNRFSGGILWVELGQQIKSVLDGLNLLIRKLKSWDTSDTRCTDVETAADALADLWLDSRLRDRKFLLVIDNGQDKNQLLPFLRNGENVVRLATTRNKSLAIELEAKKIEVNSMLDEEAEDLLSQGLDTEQIRLNENEFHKLARRLGNWPLAIKIVNSIIRRRVTFHGQSVINALIDVQNAIEEKGVTFIDKKQVISTTINVSLDYLNDSTIDLDENPIDRFLDLSIFPKNTQIPLSVLEKLWHATAEFDKYQTEKFCEVLFELSLILELDLNQKYIRLHDIVQEYLTLKQEKSGLLEGLQTQFIKVCNISNWLMLPNDEPYLWNNYFHHLLGAKSYDSIIQTATDLGYLATKILMTSLLAVEIDLKIAKETAKQEKQERILDTLARRFSQFGHILTNCNRVEDVFATLYSRLQLTGDLIELLNGSNNRRRLPYLSAKCPLPDIIHPALVRTFISGQFFESGRKKSGMHCAINSDGNVVVSVSELGDIVVWDASVGIEKWSDRLDKSIQSYSNPTVSDCGINGDGSLIIIAFGNAVVLMDGNKGGIKEVLSSQEGHIQLCDISRDGQWIIAVVGGSILQTWMINVKNNCYEKGSLIEQDKSLIKSCSISPDGKFALLGMSNHLRLWNIKTKIKEHEFRGLRKDVFCDCDLSENAQRVAAVLSNGNIKVWDWDGKKETIVPEIKGHDDTVLSCALSRDGKRLVSGSQDNVLKIWYLDEPDKVKVIVCWGHTDPVNKCAISDNEYVVSVSGGEEQKTKLWRGSVFNDGIVQSHKPGRTRANGCVISPDEQFVIAAMQTGTVGIWDTETGREEFSLGGTDDIFKSCAISYGGDFVISASLDHRLQIWNIDAKTKRGTGGNSYHHNGPVNACVVSKNDDFVISASSDRTLKIWDVNRDDLGQIVLKERIKPLVGHKDVVHDCDISSDDRLVISASKDTRLGVWEAKSGKHLAWLEDHNGEVYACKISENRKLIVSASSDKTLKIWDAQEFGLIKTLSGEHNDRINGCAFSHDNNLLASVSSDQTLRVWDINAGTCLCAIAVDGPLYDCAWFLDNESLVAVGAGGVYFFQYVSFE
ncbi:MAG: CHAT domain-containing protein [Anaerolineae bacterium]|nr:CHAT domain-containing protein [Anaerolineae bacterium]